jgi:hypothetical protein
VKKIMKNKEKIKINKDSADRGRTSIRGDNLTQNTTHSTIHIGIVECAHGHHGAVRVRPEDGVGEEVMDRLRRVCLVNGEGEKVFLEIYEVKKYRRGRYLIKF